MCTHPFLRGGGGEKGGEPPTKFSKRGVNLQDLIFKRGVGEKKGGGLCEVGGGRGGLQFLQKN